MGPTTYNLLIGEKDSLILIGPLSDRGRAEDEGDREEQTICGETVPTTCGQHCSLQTAF